MSGLAVAVASPVIQSGELADCPHPSFSYLFTVSPSVRPLALGVGLLFNPRWRGQAAKLDTSWVLIPAIAAAGLLVGSAPVGPELPGNGKSILTVSLDSGMTLGAAAALPLLKPLLTALFLRAGAVGGLLTPALATGAAMGSVVALALDSGPNSPSACPRSHSPARQAYWRSPSARPCGRRCSSGNWHVRRGGCSFVPGGGVAAH